MDYLRKELQNREEMYNQKFNVTPSIGVLSVIYKLNDVENSKSLTHIIFQVTKGKKGENIGNAPPRRLSLDTPKIKVKQENSTKNPENNNKIEVRIINHYFIYVKYF